MIKGFVTIVALCFMHVSLIANAQDVKIGISISKGAEPDGWLINYEFSELVEAVSFENTPYRFIESDWRIQTAGATLDLSSLHVNLNSPAAHLSIALTSKNNRAVSGFYTPFLNFSDGSSAIFVGHYVPAKLKIKGGWINSRDVKTALTITSSSSIPLLFDSKREVKGINVSEADTHQYAYLGRLPVKEYGKFNLLLDPALPIWIQEAFLKAIPEFYNYFEERTRNSLSFTPLFIINFQAGSAQQWKDGGVANKQLAINVVGDGWSQNSDTELLNVLSLLAHEMAHLWNAQHWRYEENNPVWMHEGGANYFARKALLNFNYVSVEEDAAYYDTQSVKCIAALEKGFINGLQNRIDKYICGDIIYKLSALMTGHTMHLDVWNELVTTSDSLAYSERDFIQALYKEGANNNEVALIEDALQKESGEKFEALVGKYIGRHNHKNPIRSDAEAAIE